MKYWIISLACLVFVNTSAIADEQEVTQEMMQGYLEFAGYSGGAISPQQLQTFPKEQLQFIDTRKLEDYESGHIDGALHIEWRHILERKAEISNDKTVVLYCETGLLSSKAQFALSVLGYENVRVLFGGYQNWKKQ